MSSSLPHLSFTNVDDSSEDSAETATPLEFHAISPPPGPAPRPPPPQKRASWALPLPEEARRLGKRASQMIIEVPVSQLKRIRRTEGINSLDREMQHFVGMTSLHGPLRVYKSRGCTACLWGMLMFIATCVLIWQIISLLLIFAARPTVSQVSFLMSEQGLLFPKVTICSFNPVRRSFISKLNETGDFSERLLRYIMQANADVQVLYGHASEPSLLEDEEALIAYMSKHPQFTINDFYFHAGFSCQDVMKLCTFAGRQFDCCNYSKPVLTSLGRCHMLNLQASQYEWMKRQTQAGVNSGMQIVLDTHLEEQFDGAENETQPVFANTLENGFRFFVHEPESVTFEFSQAISVSPGDHLYAALMTQYFALLTREEWGNCTSTWPEGYEGPSSHLKYSAANCHTKCKARFFHDKCKCSPFVFNIDGEYRSCTPLETFLCMQNNLVQNLNETNEEFRWPECRECAVECNRREYISYNSYARGFSAGALKWLNAHNQNWTMPHIRSNFLTINVYFRDLTYTEYRQVQATTLTEIISDMGGNMGMFLGMSVFTLVEAVIFATKVTWITVSKRRREHLAAKKRREEEQRSEMEETVKSFRELSAIRLHELAANSFVHPPQPKLSVGDRVKRYIGHQMDVIRKPSKVRPTQSLDSPIRSVSQDDTEPVDGRSLFMRRFYENMLHGNGRAENLETISEGGSSAASSVIELKIDLRELDKRRADSTLRSEPMTASTVVRRKSSRKPARKVGRSGASPICTPRASLSKRRTVSVAAQPSSPSVSRIVQRARQDSEPTSPSYKFSSLYADAPSTPWPTEPPTRLEFKMNEEEEAELKSLSTPSPTPLGVGSKSSLAPPTRPASVSLPTALFSIPEAVVTPPTPIPESIPDPKLSASLPSRPKFIFPPESDGHGSP